MVARFTLAGNWRVTEDNEMGRTVRNSNAIGGRLTVAELKNMAVGATLYDGELDIKRVGDKIDGEKHTQKYRATYRFVSPVTRKRREPTRTFVGPKLAAMR